MNIAYQGQFLREGLLKLGHTLLDIPADKSIGINERIEKLGVPVDLVFLEMYNASLTPSKTNEVYNTLIYNDFYKLFCPVRFIWTHGHTPKSGVCIGVS